MVRGTLSLRPVASRLIRKQRWLPAAATLASGLALITAIALNLHLPLVLGVALALLVSSYVCGYSACAAKQTQWPSVDHLHRRQYGEVWNALTPSAAQAAEAACGERDETELRRSATKSVHVLMELVPIGPQDEVLEIGCGVGRVGLALAAHCRLWAGADMSTNMLAYASDRLQGVKNARLVKLREVGLGELADNAFHLVYTTDMFQHLDEMDRWRYVEEAFRVLRPGGWIYIDNIDLESDAGWASFASDSKRYQAFERPPWMPRPSTAAELMTYAKRAGFRQVQSHHRPPLVIVTAVKPDS